MVEGQWALETDGTITGATLGRGTRESRRDEDT